ncbi:transglutaminase domain-containing protein [Cohnella pontilimi]|nr:transglutaminase domain-containing protein [Cohnella pontilimi]
MRKWVRTGFASLAAAIGFSAYYYTQLNPPAVFAAAASSSATSKSLQAVIQSHLVKRESSFTITYQGSTSSLSAQMDKAVHAVLDADDSLGYTISSYRWNTSFTANAATIKVQVSYWEDAKQTAFVVNRVKQLSKQLIKPGMNEHEKVKAVHDWVILHVAYDRTLAQHSSYAALTGGSTVCQGYALLTYRLLNEAGIQNRIVEGTVSTGLHAWNLVKIGGKWYHLDTTFDDPVPDLKGRTSYNYYLLTDQQIRRDHRWTRSYPAAVTSYGDILSMAKKTDPQKAAFYNGLEKELGYTYLKPENTVNTMEQLQTKIEKAIQAGKKSVTVRWTGGNRLNLQTLFDGIPVLSSIHYSQKAFALGESGDVLLEVQFS